ncbi:MAG: 4Fe-4S ferredoxin [Desulfuromonas sp.]|nr:MAG: 4Fe-4S ferredoxin [Desulfuromonas sp.]
MKVICLTLSTVVFVVVASFFSVNIWAEKEEHIAGEVELTLTSEMTIMRFGEENGLSRQLLGRVFSLNAPEQMQEPVASFDMSLEQIKSKVDKEIALETEDASKNWLKIPLKFVLWFVFMAVCFKMLTQRKIKRTARLILYVLGFTLFGVILGADPSPMGTVKDAIVLYASKGVIYKPRVIAFTIFTLTVVFANKFICAWGCQLGTLQDFIFRLNRNKQDSGGGEYPQIKVPFVVSNSVRVLFAAALVWVAFTWTYDITHEIDPFKIFKPLTISHYGWMFILVLLTSSIFVYRPWCHFFCPFGLTGWLFEKMSLLRIKVNYDTCISCEACVKACPSAVMGAILKREKTVIPDCFSCGNCIEACPTQAVTFSCGKREKPPEGKFCERKAG